MAKELPYFKFEPAEYITKDISFCSYAAQGLFINLCSHYWQRNCKMTLSQAERRFKDKELINELLEEGVISHQNGKLIIKFLIQQRDEAIEKSNVNKANGSKGGRPRKAKQNPKETENKPNGYDSLSETKGIRRDKIKEDNTYSEGDFLKNWNEARTYETGEPSFINKLKQDESGLFWNRSQEYKKEDFHKAIKGLFGQEKIPKDIMWFRPKHFLANIETYLDAEQNKQYKLYA